MKTLQLVVLVALLGGVTALFGCGGSAGDVDLSGQPASYTGITDKAVVTTSNTKVLSINAYSGGALALSTDVLAKAVERSDAETSIPLYVSETITNCIARVVHTSKSTAKTVELLAPYSQTIYGYSGSAAYSISVDTTTGSVSGTMVFSNYKAGSASAVISGSVSFTGNASMSTEALSGMNMILRGVSASDDSANYSMDGTVGISASGLNEELAINMTLYSSATQKTIWLRNCNYQFNGSSNTLTFSGTYYDPLYGYVVVSTVTPLTMPVIYGAPTSGQLLFAGESNTKARVTFISGGYRIEADTTGSGVFSVVD